MTGDSGGSGSFRWAYPLVQTGTELNLKPGTGDAPEPGKNISQHHCPPVQTGKELYSKPGTGDAPLPGLGVSQPHCPPVLTEIGYDRTLGVARRVVEPKDTPKAKT